MERSHNERNHEQTERLKALRRLSDDDLARPLGEHWTIGVALAHIGYLDGRAVGAIEAWRQHGIRLELWSDPEIVINDLRLPFWQVVPPRQALEDAIRAAEALDEIIAGLSPAEEAAVRAERARVIERYRHRSSHLDEIEAELARARPA